MSGNTEFEPRIVGFLCNWCSYAGADSAGASQKAYPPNVHAIKVMCSGRVDPQFVLKAFELGADGVVILACHPGDCHYKEGNFRANQRHRMLVKLLEQEGIEPERCVFDFVAASQGDKFQDVIRNVTESVRKLGPMPKRGEVSFHPLHEAVLATGACPNHAHA